MDKKSLMQWRELKGLSKEQLAKESGLKVSEIARYESKGFASATIHKLASITMALNIDPNQLKLEI